MKDLGARFVVIKNNARLYSQIAMIGPYSVFSYYLSKSTRTFAGYINREIIIVSSI
jgi:hypothetical protein